jgi:NAD(P)-dependent dehydrogenase (short-subunit alcohol dehydrogenase family)
MFYVTDRHVGAVNLAGISGDLASVKEHDTENYDRVFAVNVEGTFNCMSAELRNMRVATADTPGGSM